MCLFQSLLPGGNEFLGDVLLLGPHFAATLQQLILLAGAQHHVGRAKPHWTWNWEAVKNSQMKSALAELPIKHVVHGTSAGEQGRVADCAVEAFLVHLNCHIQ
jgi:hypothetical protein